MQINLKKLNKREILFAVIIILFTASLLLFPSRLASKGTSPGMSALNAVLLVSNCSDVTYEKFDDNAVAVLYKSLTLDKDFAGLEFWKRFISMRYGK